MAQETPINDGGPAFPYSIHMEGFDRMTASGMSLRDWFAAQALPAIIEADGIQFASRVNEHAGLAYAQADAMLRAKIGGAA